MNLLKTLSDSILESALETNKRTEVSVMFELMAGEHPLAVKNKIMVVWETAHRDANELSLDALRFLDKVRNHFVELEVDTLFDLELLVKPDYLFNTYSYLLTRRNGLLSIKPKKINLENEKCFYDINELGVVNTSIEQEVFNIVYSNTDSFPYLTKLKDTSVLSQSDKDTLYDLGVDNIEVKTPYDLASLADIEDLINRIGLLYECLQDNPCYTWGRKDIELVESILIKTLKDKCEETM